MGEAKASIRFSLKAQNRPSILSFLHFYRDNLENICCLQGNGETVPKNSPDGEMPQWIRGETFSRSFALMPQICLKKSFYLWFLYFLMSKTISLYDVSSSSFRFSVLTAIAIRCCLRMVREVTAYNYSKHPSVKWSYNNHYCKFWLNKPSLVFWYKHVPVWLLYKKMMCAF